MKHPEYHAYGYDNANRVTTEVNAEGTVTYGYDSGGELLTARGSRTENYSYDSAGNRNMSGWTTGTDNELTASPGYTYTYDNEGNLLAQTNTSTHVTTSFSYDNRNRLTQVTVGGTVVASYTYDALNHRIGIKDNGTQTWVVFDGTSPDANPYADFSGSGTLLTRYVSTQAVDEILARTSSGGTTAWYLTDRLGSVRDVVSASKTVLDHVIYDSYGNITSETNATNGDRFKFTGREYDAATGLYYYRARYYDPATGRFVSQDPKGFAAGDTNLFRYVGNQTTNLIDPTGLDWHWYNPFSWPIWSATYWADAAPSMMPSPAGELVGGAGAAAEIMQYERAMAFYQRQIQLYEFDEEQQKFWISQMEKAQQMHSGQFQWSP